MRVTASVCAPPALPLDWAERWEGADRGLLACWVRGLEMAAERPELAAKALAGELVVLPWRGGVEKELKTGKKIGSLNYLAMWQGLRGQDLAVSLADEVSLICSRTRVAVRFTPNMIEELAEVLGDSDEDLP